MASSSRTTKPQRTRKGSSTASSSQHSHDSSASPTSKTEVTINVYDLLPPGRLSTLLWTLGTSLLHSGVVLHSREYAFGGHNVPLTTGVYYTSPLHVPPGGTHRVSLSQGYTYHSPQSIESIIKTVSHKFLGPRYNLLTNNCNHFTKALVEVLTGRTAPAWLNRAAGIGLALPCVVPREWVQGCDVDTAEGELVEDDGGSSSSYKEEDDMLESERHVRMREEQRRLREEELGVMKERRKSNRLLRGAGANKSIASVGEGYTTVEEVAFGQTSLAGGKRITALDDDPPARYVKRTDSAGRQFPVAERAPLPQSLVATAVSKT